MGERNWAGNLEGDTVGTGTVGPIGTVGTVGPVGPVGHVRASDDAFL